MNFTFFFLKINIYFRLLFRNVLVWDNLILPRAIAVAPNDGLMFWTDWGEFPRIERSSMDGNPESRMIIVENDLSWPNGLTLDYENKFLYWIDARLNYIGRVDWYGNHRVDVYIDKERLKRPFAISVHQAELFWTDWDFK